MIGRNMKPQQSGRCRSFFFLCLIISSGLLSGGCPNDMREQPSFSYQEAPRLHSPQGSIPQVTPFYHLTSPTLSTERVPHGAQIFAINCAHCHGARGMGDGAVAGYLPDLPANLQAPAVQQKPDAVLYRIVTNGEKVMPAFRMFLSSEERWALVAFLRSLSDHAPSSDPLSQESNQPG